MSLMACWHFSGLGLGRGQGHEQQAPHCPSLCLFLPLPPCSLLQFPRCPGYLCYGNCASLPAQTQIPPLRLPLCQHDDSAAPAGLPASSLLNLSDKPCSSDKVVFCHSLLRLDLSTKQTNMFHFLLKALSTIRYP